MSAARPGLSLVELLVAALIMAVLAAIAVPVYTHLVYRARAASALGDLQAVRVAAFNYHADTNLWPGDQGPGRIPPELEPYLGAGFSFQREHYRLDWENWELPDGTPKHPRTRVLLGVSITTDEDELGWALEELVGDTRLRYTLNDNYTFIIESI